MSTVLAVAWDLLLEAKHRKWFWGLFGAVTLVLAVLGVFLRLEVVDGALASSRLFGALLFDQVRQTDEALRPVFAFAAGVGFFGGSLFLVVACADFGPSLLAPGRIEQLLSLPVARWQLVVGTYLGLLVLAVVSTLYGAAGVMLLFGVKTGTWEPRLLVSAGLGVTAFAALAATMLAAATVVRSAAVSAGAALALFAVSLFASNRDAVASTIDTEWGQALFRAAMAPFPRLGSLGMQGLAMMFERGDAATMLRLAGGSVVFAGAVLAFAIVRFERKDF